MLEGADEKLSMYGSRDYPAESAARSSRLWGATTRLNWNQLSELTRQIDGPLYIQSLTTSSLRLEMMNPLAVNSLATQLKFSAISLNSIKSSRRLMGTS